MKTKSGVSISKRLPGMPYANAGIIIDGKNKIEILVSYETCAGVIFENDKGEKILRVYGLFSATTRKHLSFWLRSHGISYYVAKSCVRDNSDYNITLNEYQSINWNLPA